jgi:hypothetical protein
VIEATDTRLSETEKQRMVREARERVTKMLRSRMAQSVEEQAQQILERADRILEENVDHPMKDEVSAKATELRQRIDAGEEELEGTMEELLRLVDEIEASAGS